jgi:hypothetical protein
MRLTGLRCLQAAPPALLGAVAMALATVASAQMRIDAVPESVMRPYSVRDSGAIPRSEPPIRSAHALAAAAPQTRDYSWLGGALQVEAARENSNGTYTRPKLIIGLPSESMKDWMNSAGFAAEQCLLALPPNSACCRWCGRERGSTPRVKPAARCGSTPAARSSSTATRVRPHPLL